MRRRVVVSILLLSGLGTAGVFLVLWLTDSRPSLTWEAYESIDGDMTEREIVELVGMPAGDYFGLWAYSAAKGEKPDYVAESYLQRFPPGTVYLQVQKAERTWRVPGRQLDVWFDEDGRVVHKTLFATKRAPAIDFKRSVRRWFGQ